MHFGNREYVPVVRTSTAAGTLKLGSLALAIVSRDNRDRASAVSMNSIDCLSRKVMMFYGIQQKHIIPDLYSKLV